MSVEKPFVKIPLTCGKFAVIDEEDLPLIQGDTKWEAMKAQKNIWYAKRRKRIGGGKSIRTYMHRLISGALKGEIVDHRNHDGLDNRKSNLRKCTRAQNCANSRSFKQKIGFKGVIQSKLSPNYSAQITYDYEHHYLGTFPTPQLAAAAYDKAAIARWGDFAKTNKSLGLIE